MAFRGKHAPRGIGALFRHYELRLLQGPAARMSFLNVGLLRSLSRDSWTGRDIMKMVFSVSSRKW